MTPDQGTTSGSQSTPTNFNNENLALAAATAREALLKLGANKLGAPVDRLTAVGGIITGPGDRRVTYGDLIGGRRFNLTLSPTAKRRSPGESTILGKPVPSLDRAALVTGRFEFVHSIRLPGMLHGRVVRLPGMGVIVVPVDTRSVSHIPGVTVVVRVNSLAS